MGLLGGPVGRTRRERRLWVTGIYILLILGGATMVYPFLVMISGSFKSDVDIRTYDVVPRYFYDDRVLFQKYLESRYNEFVSTYNSNCRQDEFSFQHVTPPKATNPVRIADWREFMAKYGGERSSRAIRGGSLAGLASAGGERSSPSAGLASAGGERSSPSAGLASARMPDTWSILGHATSVGGRMYPANAREFRKWVVKGCGGSLDEFNRKYGLMTASWLAVGHPNINPTERAFKAGGYPLIMAALEFKRTRPIRDLVPLSLDGRFVIGYLQVKYGKKIEDYNRAHGTRWRDWDPVCLRRTAPTRAAERADWETFVRSELNLEFIRVSPAARPEFAAFLDRRYAGDLAALSRGYGRSFASFAAVPYPRDMQAVGTPLVDWEAFIRTVSVDRLSLAGPDFLWQDHLAWKYRGNLAAVSRAHGMVYPAFDRIGMPAKEADWQEVMDRSGALRWEFATRNYKHVTEYLLVHGRGVFNTFVFCLLTILTVLIVNPVAAYAMSRFNLPSAYKILLFLLATMAFPPMVTAIPNFLLLKSLGMLNTFWALILPGIVNGFSIFLLKGFFDSQPRELYEAAQIDGAGEWTMFWTFTINLSKPILAVIALGAFNGAYGAFMFAFIVCQNESMWTLMVWLYQLQQYAHQSVTFAALLVASVPTFLVFVAAQKVILEGIVIPVEK